MYHLILQLNSSTLDFVHHNTFLHMLLGDLSQVLAWFTQALMFPSITKLLHFPPLCSPQNKIKKNKL